MIDCKDFSGLVSMNKWYFENQNKIIHIINIESRDNYYRLWYVKDIS